MKITCLQCKKSFTSERVDAAFCSGACKAAYWREKGTTSAHADLKDHATKPCEQCNNWFWYNPYADRGGKRVPKYCRDACRVAAFRARNAKASYKHSEQKGHKAPPQAKQGPDFQTGNFRDTLKIPSKWSYGQAYQWLGVEFEAPKHICVAAFRELNRRYHPDKTNGVIWPHLSTVNAAFDFLKRRNFQ